MGADNPYHGKYDAEIFPPMGVSDWYHEETATLFVHTLFGINSTATCPEKNISCVPVLSKDSWESAFTFLCGGPTSGFRWLSGYINGKRPFGSPLKNFHKERSKP